MSVQTLRRRRQAVTWTCMIDVDLMFKERDQKMTKRKIVLKVPMKCERWRTMALKVVADADGN
ncbi:hypothetical protein NC651_034655 [Populus alba x Populus x berolinensis]|nr:hypothetical protein NC651_034655 [Populus alba x Populus x berolinensis]